MAARPKFTIVPRVAASSLPVIIVLVRFDGGMHKRDSKTMYSGSPSIS